MLRGHGFKYSKLIKKPLIKEISITDKSLKFIYLGACLSSLDDVAAQEEKISVLIICQSPSQMRNAINFLNRRDVETSTADSLSEALKRLTTAPPRFVLLSGNFPHPKLESMPNLMQSTFKVECVLFSERSDRKVDARIAAMKVRHVLYGPVSGPSILLKLRQMIKEAEAPKATDDPVSREKRESSDVGDNRVTISGKNKIGSGDENDSLTFSNRGERQDDIVARFMKEIGDDSPSSNSSIDLQKSGQTFVAKGKPPRKFAAIEESNLNSRGLAVMNTDPRLDGSPFLQTQKGATGKKFGEVEKGPNANKFNEVEKGPEQNKHKEVEQRGGIGEQLLATEELARATAVQRPPKVIELDKKASQLWSCARSALLEVSEAKSVFDIPLQHLYSASLLTIHSPSLEASFLLSAGRGKDFLYGVLARLHERFVAKLREHGHSITDEQWDLIDLSADRIDIDVLKDADFSLTAFSSSMELSISFMDIRNRNPEIEAETPEFSKVSLLDIATDVPVTFDAYVYMPLNKKTIKYLKTGGTLQTAQKSRLIKDGFSHFRIKDAQLRNFKEFHARASMNEQLALKRKKRSAA